MNYILCFLEIVQYEIFLCSFFLHFYNFEGKSSSCWILLINFLSNTYRINQRISLWQTKYLYLILKIEHKSLTIDHVKESLFLADHSLQTLKNLLLFYGCVQKLRRLHHEIHLGINYHILVSSSWSSAESFLILCSKNHFIIRWPCKLANKRTS